MMEVTGGLGKRRLNNRLIIILGAVVFVVIAAAAGYYFWQYMNLKNDPDLVNKLNQETTSRITAAVGRFYALPTDEQPTIAKIQDKAKLKDQVFFKNAENGDYILIYTKAKLALLYRENQNKLINVGPVTISDTSQTKPTDQDTTKKTDSTTPTNDNSNSGDGTPTQP